jgi:nitrite reductase/ring-hydroxylating ferredoxin subunit
MKKDNQNEEDPNENSSSFFSWLSSKKEKKVEPKETKEESSTGFFRSVSNKLESVRESRQAKNRAEKEAELAAMMERDSRTISGMVSFPNFNQSGFASAFRNVSDSFLQAKDGILNIRIDKKELTMEERRLAELRLRTANEKARRLAAKQQAEQRVVDRRKKKEQAERDAKAATQKVEGGIESSADDQPESRSNPLSVAQKYISSFFESQKVKEEWVVVAPKTRIAPGQMVPITVAGLDLLLVASKDGSALYCTANSCPHLGTPLEVGMLERRPIELSSENNNPNRTSSTLEDEGMSILQETDIAKLLSQDGCEDCIVCPLHKTAFALASGEVRGEWCPYPPVIGTMMGAIKGKSSLPTFDVRTRGKNIEVRINSPIEIPEDEKR